MKKWLLACLISGCYGYAYAQVPPTGTVQPIEITSSTSGTTGAVVATLAANTVGLRVTYICGLYATGTTATTANTTAVTVANTVSGSMVFNVPHPVTPALGVLGPVQFNPCVPANASNTAITATSAADAAGTNVTVTAWGYQR